jgi:WD40-like Beta Propeller Repeat
MGSQGGIFWTRADGASQPQPLTQSKNLQVPGSFSSDGKRLAFWEIDDGRPQIWTVSVEEEGGQLKPGQPEPFLKSPSNDGYPAFSPDGHFLAYLSQLKSSDILVRPYPPPASGEGGQWQISTNGAAQPPVWSSPARHEIYYRSGDRIMAVSYTIIGDALRAGPPRVWIPKLGGTVWDLDPKGRGVAVATPVEAAQAPQQEHTVVMVQNFFDELRRRVPVK